MKRSTRGYVLILCFLILIVHTAGSCDQTDLTGTITLLDDAATVHMPLPLELEVPEHLAEIYRVHWDVDPALAGEVLYGDKLVENTTAEQRQQYFGSKENFRMDRHALFLPRKPGMITLSVEGFFRQTNPQPITTIEIEIKTAEN